ncbi:hypothetical protein [Mycolicibacter longobardus]
MRIGGFAGTVVLIWLLIGAVAAWQRGYFSGTETSCAAAGTIAATTLFGPLNYLGFNPVVSDCHLPEPSSLREIGAIV